MAWRHFFETVSLAPPSGHIRDSTSWVSNLLWPLSHLSRILQTLRSVRLKQSEKFKQTQEHQSCPLALILIFLPLTSIKFLWTHASYLTSTCGSVWNLKVSASGSLRSAIFFLDTSFNLVVLPWIISAPLLPQFPAHPIFPCQPLCECLFPGWQGVGGASSPAPDGALSGSNEGKTPASPVNSTPSFSAIWHNICRMHIQNQVTVTRTAVGDGTQLWMPGTWSTH